VRCWGLNVLAGIAIFALTIILPTNLIADENCLICHGKVNFAKVEPTGRKVLLYVDTTLLYKSVHAARGCVDCHDDVIQIPHQPAAKVNCRRCHYSGNPVGAPQGELYDEFTESVHGKALAEGNSKAPICQDCHGSHEVLSPDSTGSSMNRSHRPTSCGKCHMEIYATYRESVHGHAFTNGNVDAPDCVGCHGEHNIKGTTDSESQVSPEHISQTCGGCHGPMGVAAKYGIKTDRTTTFEESFHGIAHKMDNRTVANCASCHGFHDIRPANDPKSTVHAANIVKTCGKPECHPEATPQFASGKIHVDPTKEEAGLVYYITKFFTILTVATLAGLFTFIILDLMRRAKSSRSKK
jgi:Cytochrome c7 and related cytochrome c